MFTIKLQLFTHSAGVIGANAQASRAGIGGAALQIVFADHVGTTAALTYYVVNPFAVL